VHDESKTETVTLGGGCFWCVEAVFNVLRGVDRVISGYAGGSVAFPTYEQVCSGRTGHAEVAQITFNPAIISFREILEVFFTTHDPTTLDRQGADVGSQYRSVIFYQSPEQQKIAQDVIAEINASGIWRSRIVTQVEPLDRFYPAEGYHQNYFELNGNQPYCQVIIAPKVAKVRERYLARLKR
jgi:peptide-methionine (S)-S-oxide reductase